MSAPADGLYSVDDVTTFNITLTNTSGETHSYVPASTNLSENVSKYRWCSVSTGTTKTGCTGLATYTVAVENLKASGLTPQIAYEVEAVEYAGKALSTPEAIKDTMGPVKANSPWVESIMPPLGKKYYKLGDIVTCTVRVCPVSSKTINVAATESSFGDLGHQCHWGGLRSGKGAVYNYKPLTHTITQIDVNIGCWTPSITLTATGTDGTVLQTLTATGSPINVVGDHPRAAPIPAPNMNTGLPISMS